MDAAQPCPHGCHHLDMNMEALIETLKIKIIEILNLPDVTPADIPVDSDLMSTDLDIDSIDILELVIMLRKDYGVNIKNKEMAKKVFASLRSLGLLHSGNVSGVRQLRGAPIYIAGMGIISALGYGVVETAKALKEARCYLRPITLFALTADAPQAVGEVKLETDPADPLPRTHCLAHMAAGQALAGKSLVPDAIVVGTTTGGILTTEAFLEKNVAAPHCYRYHGVGSVAEELARRYGCSGPLITVSTACSSGAVALLLAMQMLRRGKARRVLAGGVDSLCRLTYFGFNSLQLIDPIGARPLDRERRGLSLAEGAALLLLTTEPPAEGALQLLGAGLSCDAYHATAPLADGQGALAAMQAAWPMPDWPLRPSTISTYTVPAHQTMIWPRPAPSKPFSVIALRRSPRSKAQWAIPWLRLVPSKP